MYPRILGQQNAVLLNFPMYDEQELHTHHVSPALTTMPQVASDFAFAGHVHDVADHVAGHVAGPGMERNVTGATLQPLTVPPSPRYFHPGSGTPTKLPGLPYEGGPSAVNELLPEAYGRVIDKNRMPPRSITGGYIALNFEDPRYKPILNPNFKFPEPRKPNLRPWLPIFTKPWWKFDNPIDNNLV